jgi:hypothetical protein
MQKMYMTAQLPSLSRSVLANRARIFNAHELCSSVGIPVGDLFDHIMNSSNDALNSIVEFFGIDVLLEV